MLNIDEQRSVFRYFNHSSGRNTEKINVFSADYNRFQAANCTVISGEICEILMMTPLSETHRLWMSLQMSCVNVTVRSDLTTGICALQNSLSSQIWRLHSYLLTLVYTCLCSPFMTCTPSSCLPSFICTYLPFPVIQREVVDHGKMLWDKLRRDSEDDLLWDMMLGVSILNSAQQWSWDCLPSRSL